MGSKCSITIHHNGSSVTFYTIPDVVCKFDKKRKWVYSDNIWYNDSMSLRPENRHLIGRGMISGIISLGQTLFGDNRPELCLAPHNGYSSYHITVNGERYDKKEYVFKEDGESLEIFYS